MDSTPPPSPSNRERLFILAALGLATAALIVAVATWLSLASPAAFQGRVRAYLVSNPEVLIEASTALQQRQAAQAQTAVRAALLQDRSALERDPADFVANPDGRVTVTEFYDYRCPHCVNVAPQVLAFVRETPDVRFVFKELPIFGAESERAARAALAVKAAGKDYLALHQAFMAARPLNDAVIDRVMREQGLDPRLADDPALNARLARTQALASRLRIEGTPAFIIGRTVIPGEDMAAVRAAVAAERRRP